MLTMRGTRRSSYEEVAKELAEVLERHGYTTAFGRRLDVIQCGGTWIVGDGHGDPINVLRQLEIKLPSLTRLPLVNK